MKDALEQTAGVLSINFFRAVEATLYQFCQALGQDQF
jgi:hypothetical protein